MQQLICRLLNAAILLVLVGCGQTATIAPGDPARGEAIFVGNFQPQGEENVVPCRTCHHRAPEQGVLIGPNLAGVYERAQTRVPSQSADDYLRASIITHDDYVVEGFEPGLMLSVAQRDYGEVLTPEQINDVVAYLKTLDSEQAAATPAAPTTTPIVGPPTDLVAAEDGRIIIKQGEQDEQSYSFVAATGWQAQQFSTIVIAQPPEASFAGGPFIGLRTGAIEDLNIPNVDMNNLTSIDGLADELFASFVDEAFEATLGEVAEVIMSEVTGRVVDVQGTGFGNIDGSFAGRIAVMMLDPAHVLIVVGVAAPREQWEITAEFDALLTSLQVAEGAINAVPTDVSALPAHPPLALSTAMPLSNSACPAVLASNSWIDTDHPSLNIDRDQGPRFACVSCHVTHNIEMDHASNPTCGECHSGSRVQRHCVDCHGLHNVFIPHEPENPGCASCHTQNLPGEGIDAQHTLVLFLAYLFHEI